MQVQHTHALLHVYNHILTFTKLVISHQLLSRILAIFLQGEGVEIPSYSHRVRRWGSLGCRVKLRRTFHGETSLGVDTTKLVGRLTAVLSLVRELRVAYDQSYVVAAYDRRVLGAVRQLASVAEAAHAGGRLTELHAALEHGLARSRRRHVVEWLEQLRTDTA